MKRKIRIAIPMCLTLLTIAPARAQKIPLESDNSRVVQLHDVGDMVRATALPGVQPGVSSAEVEERERDQLERLADFVSIFMQPPLDGEEDVMLTIQDGAMAVLESGPAQHAIRGDQTIVQLVVGTEAPAEVVEMNGIQLEGDAEKLIQVLFPVQHPQMENQAL